MPGGSNLLVHRKHCQLHTVRPLTIVLLDLMPKCRKCKMNRQSHFKLRTMFCSTAAWAVHPWQISLSYAQLVVSDLWCTLLISFWQNNLQQLHTISLSPLGYFSEIYELQAALLSVVSNLHTRFWKQCWVEKQCPMMAGFLSLGSSIYWFMITFHCSVNRLHLLAETQNPSLNSWIAIIFNTLFYFSLGALVRLSLFDFSLLWLNQSVEQYFQHSVCETCCRYLQWRISCLSVDKSNAVLDRRITLDQNIMKVEPALCSFFQDYQPYL